MTQHKDILQLLRRLQVRQAIRVMLLFLILSTLAWMCWTLELYNNWVWLVVETILLILIGWFSWRSKEDYQNWSIQLLNEHFKDVNEAAELLFLPKPTSQLAQLQQNKLVSMHFNTKGLVSYHVVKKLLLLWLVCLVSALAVALSARTSSKPTAIQSVAVEKAMVDSIQVKNNALVLQATIQIKPPAYTRMAPFSSSYRIETPEAALVDFHFRANQTLKELGLVFTGSEDTLFFQSADSLLFQTKFVANNSGIYHYYFKNSDTTYASPLYNLLVIKDKAPEVDIQEPGQYLSFKYNEAQQFVVEAVVLDDYGIDSISMVATVSKGSGESVKFREEILPIDNIRGNLQQKQLVKNLDLRQLGMEAGDELYYYFYVEDNKRPERQSFRSETYFASIEDTTTVTFSLEGNLGIDLMPEYFRSQRQIIIETEQLIKDKNKLSEKEFNHKSNELGYDQKVLRLKYGQFLGEEFESGVAEHDHEATETDEPVEAQFGHVHDGENEHNLVEEEEEHEDDKPTEKDFMHDHGDPEEHTFFKMSVRAKLKAAMTEMWDAELYLRLYEPEKSLPYQYKALKLIKEIKNHARVYVHRIGFDPPPIKPENRLKGEQTEIKGLELSSTSESAQWNWMLEQLFVGIRNEIHRNEPLDQAVLEKAGVYFSTLAAENPLLYIDVLNALKTLSENSTTLEIRKQGLKDLEIKLLVLQELHTQRTGLQPTTNWEFQRIYNQKLDSLQE